jgi:hypothetical protein
MRMLGIVLVLGLLCSVAVAEQIIFYGKDKDGMPVISAEYQVGLKSMIVKDKPVTTYGALVAKVLELKRFDALTKDLLHSAMNLKPLMTPIKKVAPAKAQKPGKKHHRHHARAKKAKKKA